MCGIVGYNGKEKASEILLDGLSKLEYRGYDSAGIAVREEKGIEVFKAKGKIANLKEDYKILVEANKDAKEFWKKNDPELDNLKKIIEYHLAAHSPTAMVCLWGYPYCCELAPNVFVPESYRIIKWLKQQPIVSFKFIDIITALEAPNCTEWDQIVNEIERIIIPNENIKKKYF